MEGRACTSLRINDKIMLGISSSLGVIVTAAAAAIVGGGSDSSDVHVVPTYSGMNIYR
jgi:hypothetical protein